MGRSPTLLLAIILLAASTLAAMEVFPPAVEVDSDAEPLPAGLVPPGRMPPVALPEMQAVTFTWDDSRTMVVIEAPPAGKGLRAPAWVVTYDQKDNVQVGYRATAFLDKEGLLQIDARNAIIVGPRREGWSPDSFAIAPDGAVVTIDDRNDSKTGTVTARVKAKESCFRQLLTIAMAIVREAS
jgi:hypothetical protein